MAKGKKYKERLKKTTKKTRNKRKETKNTEKKDKMGATENMILLWFYNSQDCAKTRHF